MTARYDTIGLNYANLRKPDARIAAQIDQALGNARTILNVGAGAGSYEPAEREVTAVEPSAQMIRQRPPSNVVLHQGHAEDLPFEDNQFDASMAVLTIHHWTDQARGAREMRRVTKGQVVFLTFDPAFPYFWLADYFPKLITIDEGQMPLMPSYESWLGPVEIAPVYIPHDCSDGFLAAYWKRPSAYLDEHARAAISSFWSLGDIRPGLKQLEEDITSGRWAEKYAHLLALDKLDCGYRLVKTI